MITFCFFTFRLMSDNDGLSWSLRIFVIRKTYIKIKLFCFFIFLIIPLCFSSFFVFKKKKYLKKYNSPFIIILVPYIKNTEKLQKLRATMVLTHPNKRENKAKLMELRSAKDGFVIGTEIVLWIAFIVLHTNFSKINKHLSVLWKYYNFSCFSLYFYIFFIVFLYISMRITLEISD